METTTNPHLNLQHIHQLIQRQKWTWAKTYISLPHEYITRNRSNLTPDEFNQIVEAQRTLGHHEPWGKYNLPYLYLDGYKYWTMGNPLEETKVINRQKIFSEFDQLEYPLMTSRDMNIYTHALNILQNHIKAPTYLEIGSGDGLLPAENFITPANYLTCEPSQKLTSAFRTKHKNFHKRIITKSFEEISEKWTQTPETAIISLFGSASYVMTPYLNLIAKGHHPHLLMFYKDNYCPPEYHQMHHFPKTQHDLEKLFPHSKIYPIGNYYIVTSQKQ